MLHLDALTAPTARVTLSLAIMLLAGFLATRVTKKLHLPDVTGYILAGVAIGPYALNLLPLEVIQGMDFITDVALAFIAFGVGRYFKWNKLKSNGPGVIVVTIFESLAAFALVTLVMVFLFRLSLPFSLLLGAISSATAPASTIMTIRQYRAKGPFVNTILEVVALDDAVCLIAFSACTAVVSAEGGDRLHPLAILEPILFSLLSIAGGVLVGLILSKTADPRTRDHRLILVVAALLAVTGLCSAAGVSPLLSCMAVGTAYINAGGRKKTFDQVGAATPPILLLFFVLSGARLQVPMLATAGVVGLVYFFIRILGKYAGAWLGCAITHTPTPTRRYLGLALIPQAGVSIGLAVLAERLLPGPSGSLVSTIILSSGVLYELVGPACVKASLFLSHTLVKEVPEETETPA